MSVQTLIQSMYNSDLDLSTIQVDEFIQSIKTLANILKPVSAQTKRTESKRRYNSILAKYLSLNDVFESTKISDIFRFNWNDTSIDIVIKNKCYYVGVCGAWRPKEKTLNMLLANYNLNFEQLFDFPEVKTLTSFSGCFSFYGGKDFPCTKEGLNRILRLFNSIISAFLSSFNPEVAYV